MEREINQSIIDILETTTLEESNGNLLEFSHPYLQTFINEYKLEETHAKLFLNIMIYMLRKSKETISIQDIVSLYNLNITEQLKVIDIINRLIEMGFCYDVKRFDKRKFHGVKLNRSVGIDDLLLAKIIYNFDILAEFNFDNSLNACDSIVELMKLVHAEDLPAREFFRILTHIEKNYGDNAPFLKRISQYTSLEKICIYKILSRDIFFGDRFRIDAILHFSSSQSEKRAFSSDYERGTLKIISDGFIIEKDEVAYFKVKGRHSYKLNPTDEIKYFDTIEEGEEFVLKNDMITHLKSEDIQENQLFFSGRQQERIDQFYKLVDKTEFTELQERLERRNLPQGFVSLLYGLPGTGKTAVVYDIAKTSGRDIFHVDIANIKDQFVGESEKRLKSIFSSYSDACEKLELEPILLFNEADAIFSNRTKVQASVDNMYNAMQNILLEQLENFQGILFATTNIEGNFDDAFSRRFLFKEQFLTPVPKARASIWRIKLEELEDDVIKRLSQYELSGGEINNVVKKSLISSVISGEEIDEEFLVELIEEELQFKTRKQSVVGF